MRFAAFGRTSFLYKSIEQCAAAGHVPVLIGTCEAAPEYTVTETDFRDLADRLQCAFFCDAQINKDQYIQLAKQSGAEAAISVNWLTLVGQKMMEQFQYGIINAHAGDLPRYKGNACPNWAIIAGEDKVVVTLHKMVAELDAGPIFLQRSFPLSNSTYVGNIYDFLENSIPAMFVEALNGLANGTLVSRPQSTDPAAALRCFPRVPGDGLINWNKPADELERLVRASAEPFSGAYSFYGNEKIVVWRAHAEVLHYGYMGIPGQVIERRNATGEVLILTGKNALVLEEISIGAEGRRRPVDVLQSSRIRLGIDIEEQILELRKAVERLLAKGPQDSER
jgi:methionyl-tRNA formyltransferase